MEISLTQKKGNTSHSNVVLAYNKRTKGKCALKVTNVMLHPEAEKEVQNEINILKELNHPNIVTMHHYYSNTLFTYQLLDYLGGGHIRYRKKKDSEKSFLIYTETDVKGKQEYFQFLFFFK